MSPEFHRLSIPRGVLPHIDRAPSAFQGETAGAGLEPALWPFYQPAVLPEFHRLPIPRVAPVRIDLDPSRTRLVSVPFRRVAGVSPAADSGGSACAHRP